MQLRNKVRPVRRFVSRKAKRFAFESGLFDAGFKVVGGGRRTAGEGLGEIGFRPIAKRGFPFGKLRYVFEILVKSARTPGLDFKSTLG